MLLNMHSEKLNMNIERISMSFSEISQIKKKMERKANEDELQETVRYMRNLPRNEELVELYNKTVPQLGIFQRILNEYSKDQARFK